MPSVSVGAGGKCEQELAESVKTLTGEEVKVRDTMRRERGPAGRRGKDLWKEWNLETTQDLNTCGGGVRWRSS
jgi:hypothetical protein